MQGTQQGPEDKEENTPRPFDDAHYNASPRNSARPRPPRAPAESKSTGFAETVVSSERTFLKTVKGVEGKRKFGWSGTSYGQYLNDVEYDSHRFARIFHGHRSTVRLRFISDDVVKGKITDPKHDPWTQTCLKHCRLREFNAQLPVLSRSTSNVSLRIARAIRKARSDAIYVTMVPRPDKCGAVAISESHSQIVVTTNTHARHSPPNKYPTSFVNKAVLVHSNWLDTKDENGRTGFDRVFLGDTVWLKSRFLEQLAKGNVRELVCPRPVVEARIVEAVVLHVTNVRGEVTSTLYKAHFLDMKLKSVVVKVDDCTRSLKTSIFIVTRDGAEFDVKTDDALVRRCVRPFCNIGVKTELVDNHPIIAKWLFLLLNTTWPSQSRCDPIGKWCEPAVRAVLDMMFTDVMPNLMSRGLLQDVLERHLESDADDEAPNLRKVGQDPFSWLLTTNQETIDALQRIEPSIPVNPGIMDAAQPCDPSITTCIDGIPNGPVCHVNITFSSDESTTPVDVV